jgi:hypothetical protein
VELLRDGEPFQALEVSGASGALDAEVSIPAEAGVHAYYLRVVQRDGAMAWSSPIWIDGAGSPGSHPR